MKPMTVRLFEAGFLPLVSVIPPNAPLSPTSKVLPSQRGKTPGRRLANGTWVGYNWLKHVTSKEDVHTWANDGANIGILAEYYPGVDIDSLDPWISSEVADIAREVLGPAPSRVGLAPKQLLMYRTGTPFARLAIIIHAEDGTKHLIEVLGKSRQYLVRGDHPSGSPYTWDRDITEQHPDKLTWITREDIERFFQAVEERLGSLPGIERIERVGDGRIRDRSEQEQADLLAPSIDALSACVRTIPNDDELFPGREEYIKMGYAVRAAAGVDEEDGFEVFAEWCSRHVADGRVEGNPDTWRADWRRMHGPYVVGWGWLADVASPHGFNAARYEFEADPMAVADAAREEDDSAPEYSDAWLADLVITERGHAMRFVPASEKWYIWNQGRWEPDAELLADHYVNAVLRRLGAALMRKGATDKEKQQWGKLAGRLCSAVTHRNVRHVMRSDPRITTTQDAFDGDPWLLNTPGGTVELYSGTMTEHRPADLCSRFTSVTPDSDMEIPVWKKFLDETTQGDVFLQEYLQRLSGYALTGSTEEQMFAFVWGSGGNGKGTFLTTILEILHHYHTTAPMTTFTVSRTEQHPTELAGLVGARLVTAVETQGGRRWDEQRIKSLTGGDQVRARLMRQDFFTFRPQFTLLFIGNHKPEIRDLDDAIRRRVHLIPFTRTVPERDTTLDVKLRKEYPGILNWMIDGCLKWQQDGLNPPEVVLDATQEYFEDEDPVGRWIEDECVLGDDLYSPTLRLYQSWEQWSNARGEYTGSVKRFAQILQTKQFDKTRSPTLGRTKVFRGLGVRDDELEKLI